MATKNKKPMISLDAFCGLDATTLRDVIAYGGTEAQANRARAQLAKSIEAAWRERWPKKGGQ